jgi:hypothetical protein
MNAVIEITHYGANVTYVRKATVSPWLAGPISRQPSAGGMLRGSWVSLAVAAAPIELARSDWQSGGYSEPEVGFGVVAASQLSSSPRLSFTAWPSFCLQPRYRSVV